MDKDSNNIKGFNKINNNNTRYNGLDKLMILIIFSSYYIVSYSYQNRQLYLDLINYLSFFLVMSKIIILIQYNDIVFYLLKIISIYIVNNLLIKNHNPFFTSLFFWVPLQDIFRVILMIKFSNYFFELDSNYLSKTNNILNISKRLNYFLNYKIFLSFTKIELFNKNKKKFSLLLILSLILIKATTFFIEDNTTPSAYKSKIKSKKYFICANLFNNEDIIDSWTSELLKLVDYLGKENVYISILENGDSNDKTIEKLLEFEIKLNNLNIPNTIITHKIYLKKSYTRINFLVELRNRALEPMYSKIDWMFDEFLIVFFNDIVYKWQDVVKLIMTNDMDYDMACALDFYYFFYDVWVSRDLDGGRLLKFYPYFRDKNSQDRVINGEPIRVFSCWNGVSILNPMPFKQYDKFKFRPSIAVMESECFLICQDYWIQGFNKILINPNVKVAYEHYYYYTMKYFDPIFKIHSYFSYYFKYLFEDNPNSSNLSDKNIIMRKNWRFFV